MEVPIGEKRKRSHPKDCRGLRYRIQRKQGTIAKSTIASSVATTRIKKYNVDATHAWSWGLATCTFRVCNTYNGYIIIGKDPRWLELRRYPSYLCQSPHQRLPLVPMVVAVAGELGRKGVHVLRRGYREREQLQSVDQQSVRKLGSLGLCNGATDMFM